MLELESEANSMFVLVASVKVDYWGPKIHLSDVQLPRMLFLSVEGTENLILRLRRPWRRESGLRLPHGSAIFHYCISSEIPGDEREFFIPQELVISPAIR